MIKSKKQNINKNRIKKLKKNNSSKKYLRNKVNKRGGGIDDLIKLTQETKISELPSDIEEVACHIPGRVLCLKCKICGFKSGTSRILDHYYSCKYKQKYKEGPFQEGVLMKSHRLDASQSIAILQREYGIINSKTEKKIIGSYGASTCIILCMRNRNSYETILAHIDEMTLNPLKPFLSFNPSECDVYIIGGDIRTEIMVNHILEDLKSLKYTIIFAHIIDNKSNRFAINCLTGEAYINEEINPMVDLPIVYDVERRTQVSTHFIMFSRSELKKVDIK